MNLRIFGSKNDKSCLGRVHESLFTNKKEPDFMVVTPPMSQFETKKSQLNQQNFDYSSRKPYHHYEKRLSLNWTFYRVKLLCLFQFILTLMPIVFHQIRLTFFNKFYLNQSLILKNSFYSFLFFVWFLINCIYFNHILNKNINKLWNWKKYVKFF